MWAAGNCHPVARTKQSHLSASSIWMREPPPAPPLSQCVVFLCLCPTVMMPGTNANSGKPIADMERAADLVTLIHDPKGAKRGTTLSQQGNFTGDSRDKYGSAPGTRLGQVSAALGRWGARRDGGARNSMEYPESARGASSKGQNRIQGTF